MAAATTTEPHRLVMYLTGSHNVVPSGDAVKDATHVILAFMNSNVFNAPETPDEFPLFTTVDDVRSKFNPGTKVTVAIGGWGDNDGFSLGARNDSTRKQWVANVAAMVDKVGADGVDIDWEYPGGNRDDYKQIPNSERVWEIEAFVTLIEDLRAALGSSRVLSLAVPGKEVDLMAFTTSTIPRIIKQADFLNIMTYDLMNRRNTVTTHHSGVANSRDSIQRYVDRGVPVEQINLGLGYYAKWFMTEKCDPDKPVGCPTQLMEDPATGADLGKTGAFSWHNEVPEDLRGSFARATSEGAYDVDGSYYYWDAGELRWWSFDTAGSIRRKFADVVKPLGLGGVFAWGLGEDAPAFEHFGVTAEEMGLLGQGRGEGDKDEL